MVPLGGAACLPACLSGIPILAKHQLLDLMKQDQMKGWILHPPYMGSN